MAKSRREEIEKEVKEFTEEQKIIQKAIMIEYLLRQKKYNPKELIELDEALSRFIRPLTQ
jgi:hypothetical protein